MALVYDVNWAEDPVLSAGQMVLADAHNLILGNILIEVSRPEPSASRNLHTPYLRRMFVCIPAVNSCVSGGLFF